MELAALCGDELAQRQGFERDSRLKMICARWAELDPAGGLEWIAHRKPEMEPLLRGWLLTEWALLDSDAAWAAIPPGPEGDHDRFTVTHELLHIDREIFMRWFRQVKEPIPQFEPAWLMIAERYPEEFEAIALDILAHPTMPGEDMRHKVAPFYEIMARLRAEKDPSTALDWALSLDPMVSPFAASAALRQWAKADPLEAWKKLASMDEEQSRQFRYDEHGNPLGATMLRRIAEDDSAAAMKLILGPGASKRIYELGGIHAMTSALGSAIEKGTMSGVDAYRLLNSAKGSDSNLGLNVFTKMWTNLPLDRLEQSAKDILAEPPAHLKDTALAGITGSWMAKDEEAALAFIAGIPDTDLRKRVFGNCFATAYGGNIDTTSQAGILRRVAPEDRAGAFNAYLDSYGWNYSQPEDDGSLGFSERSPELFAPLFEDLPPSSEVTRAIQVTAKKWGELDPASALEWAEQLKDPAAKQTAWSSAIDGWVYHDPYAAAEYLSKAPAGPQRDAATLPLVRKLSESAPGAAWEWAASVGDLSLQSDARIIAFKSWEKQSPDEARTAFRDYLATLSPAAASKFHSRMLLGK